MPLFLASGTLRAHMLRWPWIVSRTKSAASGTLVTALLAQSVGSAQTVSGAPAYEADWRQAQSSGDDEYLVQGDQRYPASIGGLRRYVDTLRTKDPALYRTLDEEVASLETRRVLALTVVGAGAGAGVGLGIAGYVLSTNRHESDDSLGTGLFIGGLVLLVNGPLLGAALLPGRRALSEVVGLHNRNAPTPLTWSVDADPATGRWVGAVGGTF